MVVFLVGGPSGIGKDWFIGRLQAEVETRQRFGIPNDACYLTAKKGDELKNWKERLKVAYASDPSATVVLKWQASMHRSSVEWICREFPGTEVRGLFLWLEENKHVERFLGKHQGGYAPADRT